MPRFIVWTPNTGVYVDGTVEEANAEFERILAEERNRTNLPGAVMLDEIIEPNIAEETRRLREEPIGHGAQFRPRVNNTK